MANWHKIAKAAAQPLMVIKQVGENTVESMILDESELTKVAEYVDSGETGGQGFATTISTLLSAASVSELVGELVRRGVTIESFKPEMSGGAFPKGTLVVSFWPPKPQGIDDDKFLAPSHETVMTQQQNAGLLLAGFIEGIYTAHVGGK